ncbi:MAG: PEP-utilizing enzyme [Patescibacteria group bacterium]
MTSLQKIKKSIKKDWYIQGFNAVPLYLGPSAISGIHMAKDLGFGYSAFLFHYQNGYGEMAYLNTDIKKIWQTVRRKMIRDRKYLEKVKRLYYSKIKSVSALQVRIWRLDLKKLSEKELVAWFKASFQAQIDTVGVGHLVESIGMSVEKEFKIALLQAVGPRLDFNQLYTTLTAPSESSFISRQEAELHQIALSPRSKQQKRLLSHVKRYYWIQNSYTGPKHLTVKDFQRRLYAARGVHVEKFNEAKRQKKALIASLKLNKHVQELISLVDFTTIWQDDRKANILMNVSYLDTLAKEVARRVRLPLSCIYQLGVNEVFGLRSIDDVAGLRHELIVRQRGCLVLLAGNNEYMASGREYRRLVSLLRKVEKRSSSTGSAIHGTVANGGTAMGRVIVCKNILSIAKVGRGDVIVASMTRPEFMPALKKASAIVTDEGGITCHAAIVARELNIPCVIGTKVGTKVLKDGMTVEVRANHGIVRIVR